MSAAPGLGALLDRVPARGPVLVLTGAGVSAESGVPTFRGPEGYWRVGSRNYHPTELATHAAFTAMPDEVWAWYLHRREVCRAARPNAAHEAIAALEDRLGDRFLLVTQNVDGLHRRAGSRRVFAIHGDIDLMRCAGDCDVDPMPIPAERDRLRCPTCGGPARPHVLWFDESYDERLFRYASSMRAAAEAALLVVIGTSGATTLPARICEAVAARRAPFVVVDPEPTSFAALAEASGAGLLLRGAACAVVPALCDQIALKVAGV